MPENQWDEFVNLVGHKLIHCKIGLNFELDDPSLHLISLIGNTSKEHNWNLMKRLFKYLKNIESLEINGSSDIEKIKSTLKMSNPFEYYFNHILFDNVFNIPIMPNEFFEIFI